MVSEYDVQKCDLCSSIILYPSSNKQVPGLINKLRKYMNTVECMHNHQWCPYKLETTHCALCCACIMYQEQDKGQVSGCSCGHLAVLPIALFKCLYCLKRRREGGREGEEGGREGGGKEGEGGVEGEGEGRERGGGREEGGREDGQRERCRKEGGIE